MSGRHYDVLDETTAAPGVLNVAKSWRTDGVTVSNFSHSAVLTRMRFDALRRETSRLDGRGNETVTEYDALGRVARTVDALGNATGYAYDAMGRVAAVTDALGHAVVYEYDFRGNKTYEGGATYPVRYEYDAFGNKVSMTTYRNESDVPMVGGDALGAPHDGDTTRWLYDDATGLVTNKLYADGLGPRYEYDANGRLTKRTWARGVVTTYAYDGWGNLVETAYSDDTPTVTLAYDALGRQTEAHDAAGVTTFAYDAYGENINETVVGVAGTNTIERFYDDYGRDTGYALNGVRQTILAYDEHTGRLATMSVPAREDEPHHSTTTTSTYNSFHWTYLPNSDLKSLLTYPNGLTASWQYDANNQLLQVRNAYPSTGLGRDGVSPPSETVVSQFDYTYDAAGRRIACAHSGTAFTQPDALAYAYNVRSELTNAVAEVDSHYRYSYDFDPIGNRVASCERGTNTTYAANELNQYTQIDEGNSAISAPPRETFNPEFDADGNQTLVKTATGIWRVTYNGENRPILWTCLAAFGPIATNGETIAMSYDRMGRRVTKNVECGVQSADRSCFIYNGYLQVYNSHSPTPTLNSNSYIWDCTESVATRPLAWHNSALDTPHSALYYTHDGNKNVSEVISFSGDLAAHYDYAPFGTVIAQCGVFAAANSWRFSSEFADDELGCDYYNYREYEPVTGRWMQRDLIEERGGVNLYDMCNCVYQTDVLGENRYITQFDILNYGGSGGTQLHVGVAVDDWKCENGQWVKVGVITFNFGARNDFLHRVFASLWILQGDIVESKGLNLEAPITLNSTPCQDLKMAELIRKEAKDPPFYNVLFYQCIFWSVGAVNYGMSQ